MIHTLKIKATEDLLRGIGIRKRLFTASLGLLFFAVSLAKEVILPDESKAWHEIGLILYCAGAVILLLYLIFLIKLQTDRKGEKNRGGFRN